MGSLDYPSIIEMAIETMTRQKSQIQLNGISAYIKTFVKTFKLGVFFQTTLIAILVILFVLVIATHAWNGTSFSMVDKLILSILGICQFMIALAIGIYSHHTKKICAQLYEELMDIVKCKYNFLSDQYQHTILNTLSFNRYLMLAGFVAIIILAAQSLFTLYALNYLSSTTLYSVLILNILMLIICLGVPYAFNAIIKLSHHYLHNTGSEPVKVLGKTIAFTGITDDPKIISPRYYQVIRQIIGNGQHTNYVIQKITIVDNSQNKFEYKTYSIEYLKELKDLLSVQDYKAVELALLRNNIYIV